MSKDKHIPVEGEIIKIKGRLADIIFPKGGTLGVGDNIFGITKWNIEDVIEGTPVDDKRGTITVKGEFYEEIDDSMIYNITAKYIMHPKYGGQYTLLFINKEIDLTKIHNQKIFLQQFIADNLINELLKKYTNIIEILETHDIDKLMSIKGIGYINANKILAKYESNKNLAPIYDQLSEYGLTPNFIRKIMLHYKNPEQVISLVKNNPYELIKINGVGFKTADSIALKGGLNPKSSKRIAAFIQYFLEEQCENYGHSYISASELILGIYGFFGGKENILEEIKLEDDTETNNILQAINILKDKGDIVVEEHDTPSKRRIYLQKIYQLELDVSKHLKRLMSAPNNFNYSSWKSHLTELELKQGFTFDKTQFDGIKLALDNQVCYITGPAGCGKSSLVTGILSALPGYTFAQCALSGKASARLQEVTGVEGFTIHRLLEYNPSTGFKRNQHNPLNYDIIILDEMSMVGGEIFLTLLKALKDGTKLIMLGDESQIEAIGAMNIAYDMHHSHVIPTVELNTIHRQAAKSGIITIANEVRSANPFFDSMYEGVDTFGELQDMFVDIGLDRYDTRDKALDWFIKTYNGPLVNQDINKIEVLAPVKERGDACVYNLNLDIQNYVHGDLQDKPHITINGGEYGFAFYKNDKVMCTKNNYKLNTINNIPAPIYNGWTGIIQDISDMGASIYFPTIKDVVYIDINTLKDSFILGYASTVHKYQGSQVDVIIGVLDYSCPPAMNTRQLLYTMITRAKKGCILVGQNGAVNQGILTNFVSTKRTFLQEFLKNNT